MTVNIKGREIRRPIHKLCLIFPKKDEIFTGELTSTDCAIDELSQK